ncbi:hypothetical protein IAU59_005416 [Kwoniella sp. CBS 9459]
MTSLFGRKHRSSASASSSHGAISPTGLVASVPYNQIQSSGPPPVAGPSTNRGSDVSGRMISPPNSNPMLTDDGTPMNRSRRQEGLPTPTARRRSHREDGERDRRSNMTDPGGGRRSPDTGRASKRVTEGAGGEVRYNQPGIVLDPSNAGGIRYQPPSVVTQSTGPSHASHEFGGAAKHPFAAGYGGYIHRPYDPETASIATVSSVSSAQRPNRDGRYPTFDAGRTSVSSRPTPTSSGGRSTPIPSSSTTSLALPTPGKGDFHFPRPSDTEVEALFQQLLENRDLDSSQSRGVPTISSRSSISSTISNIARTASSIPVDSKWQMVEADARNRFESAKVVKRKEEELHKLGKGKGIDPRALHKASAEWYLTKALDGKLTAEHLRALDISLRTEPIDWMENFMAHQGQVVLANYLNGVTHRKGQGPVDANMELELLRCLKRSLGNKKPQIINAVVASLISPHIVCRKIAGEILVFCCHFEKEAVPRQGLRSVLAGFAALEQRINSSVVDLAYKVGRFDAWLRQLDATIDGRGRMGSMVGLSKDLKGMDDASVMDYCMTMLVLVGGLTTAYDVKARCSVRAQLETAGLLSVFHKLRQWNDDGINRTIQQYEDEAEKDRQDLVDEEDRQLLQSMRSPEDVFRALLQMTKGSKASAYLLNALRHLLLIKGEGEEKVRYFQLLDKLITSIIMSDTPDLSQDFSRAFGISVSHLVGKFVEQDKLDEAVQELKSTKIALSRVQEEKRNLQEEISSGDDGRVGKLQAQVADLEEKLRRSRAATETVTDQMEGMKRDYEQRIADLELYIQELFNMLRETNHLDQVQEMTHGPIDRKKLIHDLREQWERKKTIRKLEGKGKKRQSRLGSTMEDETDEDAEDEDGEVMEAEKVALGGQARGQERSVQSVKRESVKRHSTREKKAMSGSQFMDAEEERVRAHIEDTLTKGADSVSPFRPAGSASSRVVRERVRDETTPTRRGFALDAPPVGEKSIYRQSKKPALPPRFLEEIRFKALSRSSSAPAGLISEDEGDDYRDSQFTHRTNGTGHTSGMSYELRTPSNRDSFKVQVLSRAKSFRHGPRDSDDFLPDDPANLSVVQEGEGAPPPPLPPPPPPPPPPPSGLGGLAQSTSAQPPGMAGLLAGIKGGHNLKKTGVPPPPPPPPSNATSPASLSAVARAPLAPVSSLLYGYSDSRKDVSLVASKKMKQLQWEKVSKAQLAKTMWGQSENVVEDDLVSKMKAVNLWDEMEDEFKAKEIIYDAVKKRKETELQSVLAPDHRKRIEILMAGSTAKSFKDPEKLSEAIANFNSDLCTETFLHELQSVLPNDDDRGKLLTHSADTEAELELLHPADRLMVRLIQLPHLNDRVKGMLFEVRFSQNVDLLVQSLDLLTVACHSLRHAELFRELLNVILTMGNYLNGTNFAGGAFGFKIASINRLVDTKSSGGQNLLHFLEKTVEQHFSHLGGFLDELAKPSEASRVNYADMQATSKQMLDEIRKIRDSLRNNFEEGIDGYTKKMFRFSANAEEKLQAVRDGIIAADKQLREVQTYYGEGEEMGRPLQSQDFFGIFRTFTSSYRFCRAQNRARAEEAAARERRAAAKATLTPQTTGASTVSRDLIDGTMQRLKVEGTPRVKRERRAHIPPPSPLPQTTDFSDFMIPLHTGDTEGFDFGSLAQRLMLDENFFPGSLGGDPSHIDLGLLSPQPTGGEPLSPESPSPNPLSIAEQDGKSLMLPISEVSRPMSPHSLADLHEEDEEDEQDEEEEEEEEEETADEDESRFKD